MRQISWPCRDSNPDRPAHRLAKRLLLDGRNTLELRLTNVLEDLIYSLVLNQWAYMTTGQKNAALTYFLQQQLKSAAIAAKIR